MREVDLYAPVKAYLEAQGYEVKGEIGDCDLMARRGEEEPLVVELKRSFSLGLVLQGVARQTMFADVYLAVPLDPTATQIKRQREISRLCRRLGLGLLVVLMTELPVVEALLDPDDYRPRKNKRRAGRLLLEFEKRVGDPNPGGTTRRKRITVYRQNALRCAMVLAEHGPSRSVDVRALTGVDAAARLMGADHYGWFERKSRGVYALTPNGERALEDYSAELIKLKALQANE